MNTQQIEDYGVLPTSVVLEQLKYGKQIAYLKGAAALVGVALGILMIAYAAAQLGTPADFMMVP